MCADRKLIWNRSTKSSTARCPGKAKHPARLQQLGESRQASQPAAAWLDSSIQAAAAWDLEVFRHRPVRRWNRWKMINHTMTHDREVGSGPIIPSHPIIIPCQNPIPSHAITSHAIINPIPYNHSNEVDSIPSHLSIPDLIQTFDQSSHPLFYRPYHRFPVQPTPSYPIHPSHFIHPSHPSHPIPSHPIPSIPSITPMKSFPSHPIHPITHLIQTCVRSSHHLVHRPSLVPSPLWPSQPRPIRVIPSGISGRYTCSG